MSDLFEKVERMSVGQRHDERIGRRRVKIGPRTQLIDLEFLEASTILSLKDQRYDRLPFFTTKHSKEKVRTVFTGEQAALWDAMQQYQRSGP